MPKCDEKSGAIALVRYIVALFFRKVAHNAEECCPYQMHKLLKDEEDVLILTLMRTWIAITEEKICRNKL